MHLKCSLLEEQWSPTFHHHCHIVLCVIAHLDADPNYMHPRLMGSSAPLCVCCACWLAKYNWLAEYNDTTGWVANVLVSGLMFELDWGIVGAAALGFWSGADDAIYEMVLQRIRNVLVFEGFYRDPYDDYFDFDDEELMLQVITSNFK
jgi:hypothetical protein